MAFTLSKQKQAIIHAFFRSQLPKSEYVVFVIDPTNGEYNTMATVPQSMVKQLLEHAGQNIEPPVIDATARATVQ